MGLERSPLIMVARIARLWCPSHITPLLRLLALAAAAGVDQLHESRGIDAEDGAPDPELCGAASGGRTLHWVLRSSDLLESLLFAAEGLGVRVLRHEENNQSCPVACNGDFAGPWSKTMVGTMPESIGYSLELTHSYGIAQYSPGSHPALSAVAVVVRSPEQAAEAASGLGYASTPLRLDSLCEKGLCGEDPWLHSPAMGTARMVYGPDGYRFLLLPPTGPSFYGATLPLFHHVAVRVTDLRRSVKFYTSLLRMVMLPDNVTKGATTLAIAAAGAATSQPTAYADTVMASALGYEGGVTAVPLVLLDDGLPVERTTWAGRHAIVSHDYFLCVRAS